MALAFASSTVSANTASGTDCPVAYPGSIASGDIGVLLVGTKPFSATITTPPGWTSLGSVTNGTVAVGLDTGSVQMAAFWRAFNGGETGNLTVNVPAGDTTYCAMYRVTAGAGTWCNAASATGTDTVANTAWNVAYGSNPGITSGDLIILGGVWSTDLARTVSASALAATGATFTGIVAAGDQNPRVTTNNNLGGNTNHCACSAGTASTVATWTATHSVGTNGSGSAVLVRLREISAGSPPEVTQGVWSQIRRRM
jgi:MSHA biogenesis protein MshQ